MMPPAPTSSSALAPQSPHRGAPGQDRGTLRYTFPIWSAPRRPHIISCRFWCLFIFYLFSLWYGRTTCELRGCSICCRCSVANGRWLQAFGPFVRAWRNRLDDAGLRVKRAVVVKRFRCGRGWSWLFEIFFFFFILLLIFFSRSNNSIINIEKWYRSVK